MYDREWMEGPENGFTLTAGTVRPTSRGSVTLSGPNPENPINIDLGTLSAGEDVRSLVASVRQCRELARAQALEEWDVQEIHPGPNVPDEDLEGYVRRTVITYHHQVGTCRMGVDNLAVVDARDLRVRGLAGLRVADASVMPLVPTGNTNAPTIMIAERVVGFITEEVVGAVVDEAVDEVTGETVGAAV